jgi:hypothetical protein
MYALNASKPGETVTAVVKRDGKELKLPVTFEEGAAASDRRAGAGADAGSVGGALVACKQDRPAPAAR